MFDDCPREMEGGLPTLPRMGRGGSLDNVEGRLDHWPGNSKFTSQLCYLQCARGQDVLCRGGNDTYIADLLGMLNEVAYVQRWNAAWHTADLINVLFSQLLALVPRTAPHPCLLGCCPRC